MTTATTKKEPLREPRAGEDFLLDGCKIPTTIVPLADGGEARLYTEDYKRLVYLGVSEKWFRDSKHGKLGHVSFESGTAGNLSRVARVIMGLPRKEDGQYVIDKTRVAYRDRRQVGIEAARLNLMRHNLALLVPPGRAAKLQPGDVHPEDEPDAPDEVDAPASA